MQRADEPVNGGYVMTAEQHHRLAEQLGGLGQFLGQALGGVPDAGVDLSKLGTTSPALLAEPVMTGAQKLRMVHDQLVERRLSELEADNKLLAARLAIAEKERDELRARFAMPVRSLRWSV